MAIDEQIEDLQDRIRRIDGHTRVGNIGNRIEGLLEIGLGAMCYYVGSELNFPINVAPYLMGIGFVVDGIGSLATGKLHYVLFKATKAHPKYELQKLEEQRDKESQN